MDHARDSEPMQTFRVSAPVCYERLLGLPRPAHGRKLMPTFLKRSMISVDWRQPSPDVSYVLNN